jgi:hypothetical protein
MTSSPLVIGAICTTEEFDANLKLDFSDIVRKKGMIDYIPHGEIVRALHRHVPGCTYGFQPCEETGSIIFYTPSRNAYIRPFLIRHFPDRPTIATPAGFFPISNMASRHKAIEDPDIRHIDNCLRRGVAKEIGFHTGIGLSLWASSDPYDEIGEESTGSSSGLARLSRGPQAVASEEGGQAGQSIAEALSKSAAAAGLDRHGKQTVAMAVRADSFDEIPDEKAPKIIQLLSDPDKVKLFNLGRNSAGKTINPKSEKQELSEIVEAFKASTGAGAGEETSTED